MTEIINLEVQFFLVSVLYGIILLVVYDSIRIIRRIVPHKTFFVAVEDIIFWVIASIAIFIMIYERNNGTIRGFAILGMLLGMIIYNQLLSPIIVKGITYIIKAVIKAVKKVIGFVLKPFSFVGKKVRKLFTFSSKKVGSAKNKLLKKVKKVGKSSAKQLKNTAKTVKISVTKK